MIKADTSGAGVLAEKLKGLPAKLQTKISRVILKEALKETGAREELTGYISTHFKAHTGIYRKSVSGIKSAGVRSDPNRIISYIHFLPVSKVMRLFVTRTETSLKSRRTSMPLWNPCRTRC